MRVKGGETGNSSSLSGRSKKRESWAVPSEGLS
jgi:hypothetical protein